MPTADDTPTVAAAASLVTPLAICCQNDRSTSRRNDGAPGDFIGDRPVSSFIHPAGRPTNTSNLEVLRPPVESAQYTSVEFTNRLADWGLASSYGSVGDCFDNAAMEAFWATLKKEVRYIWGPIEAMTRSELRTVLFDYIEVFYNRSRHQRALDDRTPAETYAKSRAA